MPDIPRDLSPRLGVWLQQAAVGIAVVPVNVGDPDHLREAEWGVEVNNGLGGHSGAGSIIARCHTDLEAELLAAGLWALLEKLNG